MRPKHSNPQVIDLVPGVCRGMKVLQVSSS